MPIGARQPGVASGPSAAPRLAEGPPPDSRFRTVGYDSVVGQSAPAAGGAMEAVFGPVPQGTAWLVERVLVITNSATPTTCFIFLGEARDQNLIEGTNSGNLDVADEASPIMVPGNTELRVRWGGASDGAIGTCRVQYRAITT